MGSGVAGTKLGSGTWLDPLVAGDGFEKVNALVKIIGSHCLSILYAKPEYKINVHEGIFVVFDCIVHVHSSSTGSWKELESRLINCCLPVRRRMFL